MLYEIIFVGGVQKLCIKYWIMRSGSESMKVKGKVVPVQALEAYTAEQKWSYTHLILVQDGGEWSVSCPRNENDAFFSYFIYLTCDHESFAY